MDFNLDIVHFSSTRTMTNSDIVQVTSTWTVSDSDIVRDIVRVAPFPEIFNSDLDQIIWLPNHMTCILAISWLRVTQRIMPESLVEIELFPIEL